MKWILSAFFRGLLFVVPIGLTAYLLFLCFSAIDRLPRNWFGIDIPGLGALVVLAGITGFGLLAGNVLTSWIVGLVNRLFERVPIAKLIHGAIKDLLGAFVGEKKRFDTPVRVQLGIGAEALGFITRRELAWLGIQDRVAVYFPQSYNFAGQLLLVPPDKVTPIQAESSQVMQFVVSGGVSGSQQVPARDRG